MSLQDKHRGSGKQALTGDARREKNKTGRTKRQERYIDKGKWPDVSRDLASEVVVNEASVHYLHNSTWYCSDPQYLIDGFMKMIERCHIVGHWDERVAAHQAAADTYMQNLLEVIFNLLPMNVHHDLLKSFPTSTTTNLTLGTGLTTATTIPHFKKSTISDYINDMILGGLVVPNFIWDLVKYLNKLYLVTDSWYVGGMTVPPSYYYHFMPKWGTTSMDAALVLLHTDVSKAIKFFNFFGVPTKPITAELFEYETVDVAGKALPDELLTWYANGTYTLRDVGDDRVISPTGALNSVATTHKWWFKSGGSLNDCQMNDIMKLFSPYEGDYNPYGGAFLAKISTTQDHISMMYCDQDEDTEFLQMDASAGMYELLKYECNYDQANTINVSLTGTYLTGDADLGKWPLAQDLDLKYHAGFSSTITDGILLEWLREHTNLVEVKDKTQIHKRR